MTPEKLEKILVESFRVNGSLKGWEYRQNIKLYLVLDGYMAVQLVIYIRFFFIKVKIDGNVKTFLFI